ncbi:MAG: carbohydrate ABC transporter permease [bacterium]
MRHKEAISGYLFIMPWLVGLVVFTAVPIIGSLAYSFTKYDLLSPPRFVGLYNYQRVFMEDPRFWVSLRVTGLYLLGMVPSQLILGFVLAILLNQSIKGIALFRTLYYLPAVLPAMASYMLWMWILHDHYGLLNYFLSMFGIPGQSWLIDSRWVIPAIIILGLWGGTGAVMIIFLARLQGIPTALYEAARLDGANWLRTFWHITIPAMSPIILFNLIMQIVTSFQVFGSAYVITQGGPGDASLFYVLYLYRNAFQFNKMGYASALSWLLFIMIMLATIFVLKSSKKWVYYEAEVK